MAGSLLATIGDKDVGGLDVAMDDAFGVSSIKDFSDLDANREE
jgi:hypothetical protein